MLEPLPFAPNVPVQRRVPQPELDARLPSIVLHSDEVSGELPRNRLVDPHRKWVNLANRELRTFIKKIVDEEKAWKT